ncbi:MAG: hypothetical protein HXY29_12310 [Rhodocyclaceae bacterium]|nr:hypothetical protein [Rhodocyclaceae bacterium]
MPQSMTLGSVFVVIAAITDSIYALAASAAKPALHAGLVSYLGARLGGGVLIGLGIYTALAESRDAR